MPSALALVLVAALLHATWNLAAKRAAHATHFMWLSAVFAAALYIPVVGWIFADHTGEFWLARSFAPQRQCSGASGYNVARQTAYRVADFSVVYPIARGPGRCFRSRPRCCCSANSRACWHCWVCC